MVIKLLVNQKTDVMLVLDEVFLANHPLLKTRVTDQMAKINEQVIFFENALI